METKNNIIRSLLSRIAPLKKGYLFNFGDIVDMENAHFHVQNLECGFEASAHTTTCEMLFLNRLDEKEILAIMDRIGLREELARKGFDKLLVDIDRDEGGRHCLSVFSNKALPQNLLISIKMSEARIIPDSRTRRQLKDNLDMINIDWASAYNPGTHFTNGKPQLPGQDKPGLGVLSHLMKMMLAIGEVVSRDGFLAVADHFHLAMMYAKIFRFLDPAREGFIRAVMRDLHDLPMNDITWGFTTGTIYNVESTTPLVYKPAEQVYPLSDTLKRYFASAQYRKQAEKTLRSLSISLDYPAMKEKREQILLKKKHGEL